GPNVKAEPAADITDFFVFPRSNGDMGKRVSMVLSVNPTATATTLFSDALNYRFRLRPISGFNKNPLKAVVKNDEIRIDCRVDGALQQNIHCDLKRSKRGKKFVTIDSAAVQVNAAGGGKNSDFRLFAGAAADQLFSDRARVRMPVWRDTGFDEDDWADSGLNSQAGKNVLSIVVDLDLHKYFGKKPGLMAVVSETAMINKQGRKETLNQIDRMGRVEPTVFIVRNDETKNLWNREDTFNLSPKHVELYRKEVDEGLIRLDRFELSLSGENVRDWPTPHPWTELMVDDFLIVSFANNADGSYGVAPSTADINYLQIEANIQQGKTDFSIGGRVINENVITRMLTFL
ncbi:MAG: DUF4331 domain-containing protein, partial [Psychrosphaera sp.]|nr:DUF4331 domain-containing protein [Psychrosphaera sp.]